MARARTFSIALVGLLTISCLLTQPSLAESNGTEFRMYAPKTPMFAHLDHCYVETNKGYSHVITNVRSTIRKGDVTATKTPITDGYWFNGEWHGRIPEGLEHRWRIWISLHIIEDEKVNHAELWVWIPSTDGKEWKNTLGLVSWNLHSPGVPVSLNFEYVADGWHLITLDFPEGEYSGYDEQGVIDFEFFIINPGLLEHGSHDLIKIKYRATGDFSGEETFERARLSGFGHPSPAIAPARFGECDILVIYFNVGYGFYRDIWTSDEVGNVKRTFAMSENIYLRETNLYPYEPVATDFYALETLGPIYIVPDRDWYGGEVLNELQRYGIEHIDNTPKVVWESPLTPGLYDIVVDCNENGEFEQRLDLIYGYRVPGFEVVGMFVIPEYSLGTVSALGAPLLAIILILQIKRGRARLDGEI